VDERGAGHADGAGAFTGQPQACLSTGDQQQRGRPPQGVRAVDILKPKGCTWPMCSVRLRTNGCAQAQSPLNPELRGWAGYFKLSQSKRPLEELRYKLCLGLDERRACISASNGRGPWWNSGTPHMNQGLPKKFWDRLGLVSILDTIIQLSRINSTAVYGAVRTVV
jgi:hypothetical protein